MILELFHPVICREKKTGGSLSQENDKWIKGGDMKNVGLTKEEGEKQIKMNKTPKSHQKHLQENVRSALDSVYTETSD